jgi:RsiW-degrading membrane proteinase PrsW (M82 family)
VLLYLTLAACAFLAGWLVYRYDMYEREPWYMIVFAVALGMVAMWGIDHVELWTFDLIGRRLTPLLEATIAGTHEEGIRVVVVAGLAVFIPSQFNDPMDGIIYGSLVGLGMAVLESLDYLHLGGAPKTLPPEEIIRIIGHLLMGGITGFAFGMWRMKMRFWFPALLLTVTFSTGLHILWDVVALTTRDRGAATMLERIIAVVIMLSGIAVYGYLVVLASEWSRRVFAPDHEHRLWGWPFSRFLGKSEGASVAPEVIDTSGVDATEDPPPSING